MSCVMVAVSTDRYPHASVAPLIWRIVRYSHGTDTRPVVNAAQPDAGCLVHCTGFTDARSAAKCQFSMLHCTDWCTIPLNLPTADPREAKTKSAQSHPND